MAEFRDLATRLAQATLVPPRPTREAEELERIGAGITTGIRKEIEPFRAAEKLETIGGEYAASPYRVSLMADTGRTDWINLAKEWKTTRDAFVNWRPAKKVKVPKTRTIETRFDKKFLNEMKPGEQISVRDLVVRKNTDGTYAFRKPGEKTWVPSRLGENENIVSRFGQTFSTEMEVPGEFVDQTVSPAGQTKEQLRKKMAFLRAKINRTVPSKTELEKIVARREEMMMRLRFGRGRAEGIDKFAMEKYKAAERYINLIKSGDKDTLAKLEQMSGDIPFSSIMGYFVTYLRNINNELTVDGIRKGKFANLDNATLNSLTLLNEDLVDRNVMGWKSKIAKDISNINTMPERDQGIAGLSLLMRVAPTFSTPTEAVVNATGDQILLDTLRGSGINPAADLEGGIASLPRYQRDFNNMTKIVLEKRSPQFKTTIEKKGKNLWNETVSQLRQIKSLKLPRAFFTRGTTPDKIYDIVQENLIKNPQISKFAPTTREAFDNPTETQKRWLATFRAATGRNATFSDMQKIEEEKRKKQPPKITEMYLLQPF